MPSTLLERVNAIAGDNPLTPREKDIVARADNKISSATSASTVLGAIGGYILARKNNMSPTARLLSFFGLGIVGRQVGVLIGTAGALRTMRELPDPAKVFNLIELAGERERKNRNLPPGPRPHIPGSNRRGNEAEGTEHSHPSFDHNRHMSPPSDADATQSHSNTSVNQQTSAWARIRMGQKPDGTPLTDGNASKDGNEGTDGTRVRTNRTSYDQGKGKTDDRYERYGQESRRRSYNKYGDLIE